MKRYSRWFGAGVAMMLSLHALGTAAYASSATAAPEIDPGSIPMGLALLAGGVLMMKARRGSK
jgi:hypothetical protein